MDVEAAKRAIDTLHKAAVRFYQDLSSRVIVKEPKAESSKDGRIILIDLPYFGQTSLEAVIFVGSAMIFRAYMWWRKPPRDKKKKKKPTWKESTWKKPRKDTPHKAKEWKTYKDPSLYEFMDLAQEQKKKLKHVEDPALGRREKLKEMKMREKATPSGPLGLSQRLLQDKRQGLKQTGRPLVD